MNLEEIRQEGYELGMGQGFENGKTEGLSEGKSIEYICALTGIDVSVLKTLQS